MTKPKKGQLLMPGATEHWLISPYTGRAIAPNPRKQTRWERIVDLAYWRFYDFRVWIAHKILRLDDYDL